MWTFMIDDLDWKKECIILKHLLEINVQRDREFQLLTNCGFNLKITNKFKIIQ